MARLLRYLLILIVLAAAAGAVYALLVDLPPPMRPVEIDVAPQSQ
jgi:hypothetical protein